VPKRERVPKVVHPGRPELGVGEVGDAFRGKPDVLQVYWPAVDKYGFYLLPDLRRVRDEGAAEDEPPLPAPP
jgi:hypothetical protein